VIDHIVTFMQTMTPHYTSMYMQGQVCRTYI